MKRPYELLIFDWDGTLADSEALIVQSMQQAISELELPAREAAAIREIIGLGLAEAVSHLYPGYPEPTLRELAGHYQQAYLAATTQPVPLFRQAHETLRALQDSGYLLAVATGKSRRGLDRALTDSRLGSLFASSRCADETLSKPDPLMLNEILAELDMPSDAALMIGDTEFDVLMASQAGIASVAVASGVHEPGRLLQSGAIACLESVAGLTDWLLNRQQSA